MSWEPYPKSDGDYISGVVWQGGKSCLSSAGQGVWILRNLPWPQSPVYVEPFVGGGSVFLNRQRVALEVINDMDGRLTNFYKVCRDRGGELAELLDGTLVSEFEFKRACAMLESGWEGCEVERAWALGFVTATRFFIPGELSESSLIMPRSIDRDGKPLARGPVKMFRNWAARIDKIVERLQEVAIYERDALDLLRFYGKDEHADIYCDPPYYSCENNRYSSNDVDVERLTELLLACKGRVAISGYNGEWDHLGWRRLDFERRQVSVGGNNRRVEQLWCNYPFEDSYESFWQRDRERRLF